MEKVSGVGDKCLYDIDIILCKYNQLLIDTLLYPVSDMFFYYRLFQEKEVDVFQEII